MARPKAFKSIKELEKRIEAYYQDCKENGFTIVKSGVEIIVDEPLTVSGLASFLDVDRVTIFRYGSGEYGKGFSNTIKRARAKIERDKVAKAMLGVYDKTICIFDLKNNHGWKDKYEVENDDKPLPAKVKVEIVDASIAAPDDKAS